MGTGGFQTLDQKLDYFTGVIEKDPDFQELSPEEKSALSKEYFKANDILFEEPEPRKPIFEPIPREEVSRRQHVSSGPTGVFEDMVEEPKALLQTAQEMGIGGMEFVNGYGMGVPRRLLKEFTNLEIPTPPTLTGKALQLGGLGFGLSKSPVSKLASVIAAKTGLTGIGMGSGAVKSGIEGALIGASYTPENVENPQQELVQRGLGSAFGGALGIVVGSLTGGIKAFKQWKRKMLSDDPVDIVKGQMAKTESFSKERIAKFEERIIRYKDNITKGLQKQAANDAQYIQGEVKRMLGDMSEGYGTRLVQVGNKIVKAKGGAITQGEFKTILDDTISEMRNSNLNSGKVASEIHRLAGKYKLEIVGMADDGLPVLSSKNPDTPLNFQKIHKEIVGIGKQATKAARTGGRFTSDDIPLAIFKKNWGRFLEQWDDSMKVLNKDYAESMTVMKDVMRVVKPYKSHISSGQLAGTINRVASGKGTVQDRQLLDAIKKGNVVYKRKQTLFQIKV